MKTKYITFTPLLLILNEKESPRIIEITVVKAKTKGYELGERPLSCKKCLKFGYSEQMP